MAIVTPRAHGIDISKYDLKFDPSLVTSQLDFVVQRASYGGELGGVHKDEAFDTLYPGVSQIEIRGAYHYLSSHSLFRTQADLFLSVTKDKGFKFYVCDFESAFNVMSVGFAKVAWDFVQYVKQQTNKPVFIYTNLYGYQDYIAPSESQYGIDWDTVPLWQAQYFYTVNPDGNPSNPKGRTSPWKLWQYARTGNGTAYGVGRPTVVDLDVWNGGVSDMKQFLGIGETVPTVNPTATVTFTDKDGKIFEGSVELKPK